MFCLFVIVTGFLISLSNFVVAFLLSLTTLSLFAAYSYILLYFNISMTISNSCSCSLETLSTLKFAQRAKFIKNNVCLSYFSSLFISLLPFFAQNRRYSFIPSLYSKRVRSFRREILIYQSY
jgi:hypothetical protein